MLYLQARLKKASDYISLSEKLDIPLVQNPNAPNIKPILLKKVKKENQLKECINDYINNYLLYCLLSYHIS
ncbi:hypothetical protein [Clostridium saccharoperbutylacetonicum]|uniref:hypothetical protein n=1 Tax=Clostridium saccharoperbutylacetonicum TaxID=36745 RepID=UPI0039ED665C